MGKKKLRGKTVRKQRAAAAAAEEAPTTAKTPRSFVLSRGQAGKHVKRLATDLRRVMEPNTASSLKARQANSLRDFTAVAGPLGVSHMLVLTRSDRPAVHLRVVRLPHGPTLTFRVENYVLTRDVVSAQKQAAELTRQFLHGPLVVINNFSPADKAEKLAQTMIQNMFPSINVNNVDLNNIRRTVLWNKDKETGLIQFRHYAIKTVPTGMSRPVKKLIGKKKIPDLSKYESVEEFLERPGELSESEGEELGKGFGEVELPQPMAGKGLDAARSQAAVRLCELGPRLSLRLLKVEAGLDDGEVLYHAIFPEKSPAELAEQAALVRKKKSVKIQRRKEQEANVERKRRERDEEQKRHKDRCLAGQGSRPPPPPEQGQQDSDAPEDSRPADRKFQSSKQNGEPPRKRKFGVSFKDGLAGKPKVIVARKKVKKTRNE